MSDTVEIIYRTKAELEGSIAVQREPEKTRGRLVARGQSTAEVDTELTRASDPIGTAHKELSAG